MKKTEWTMATVAAIAVALIATNTLAACGSCGPAAAEGEKRAEVGKASCGKCAAAGKECACPGKAELKCTCAEGGKESCAKCGEAGKKKACGGRCGGGRCSGRKARGGHAMNVVNTGALKALLDSGAKVTVLDARTGKYDDGRRIPGAGSLAASATAEQAAKAIPGKDALVVTYCSNLKCPASKTLAGQLKKLGYKNVIEYPYGIDGWAASGNDVARSK